jgi:hypothetical protein
MGIKGMQAGAGAMIATAMPVVNAIPYVVTAPSGLLSSLILPLTLPQPICRQALRSPQ